MRWSDEDQVAWSVTLAYTPSESIVYASKEMIPPTAVGVPPLGKRIASDVTTAGVEGDAGKLALHAQTPKLRVMMRTKRVASIWLFIGAAACSQQSLPSWVSDTPTSPTQPPNVVTGVSIEPRAVFGGQTVEGTITIGRPTATTMQLSSSNPAASVPASVAIADGSTKATFQISTAPVTTDTLVTLTVTLGQIPTSTTLMVWPTPTSAQSLIWYVNGAYKRYTSSDAAIAGRCAGGTIDLRVNNQEVRYVFGTSGFALRRRHYDMNTTEFSGGGPTFNVIAGAESLAACRSGRTVGGFTIDELDLPPSGELRRLVVRYDLRCADGSSVFLGEMRLTNVPFLVTPGQITCFQP